MGAAGYGARGIAGKRVEGWLLNPAGGAVTELAEDRENKSIQLTRPNPPGKVEKGYPNQGEMN